MSDGIIRTTTEFVIAVLEKYIKEGDIVIDGTAGNGNDTRALSKLAGEKGRVYAFDIQEAAIEKTGKLLAGSSPFDNVSLICDSHENMSSYISEKGRVAAAVFNLGFLPSGDKSVATTAEGSVRAITEALKLLKKGGIVSAVMYPGTEAGRKERDEVFSFAGLLACEKYHVVRCDMPNQPNRPPEIIFIEVK